MMLLRLWGLFKRSICMKELGITKLLTKEQTELIVICRVCVKCLVFGKAKWCKKLELMW